MAKNRKINVSGSEISIFSMNEADYISLTDMTVSYKEGSGLIGKWTTNKNTHEYLGIWEKINNPDFNYPELGVIEKDAGTNRFIMSVGQWVDRTKALGLIVKAGRYGGTFAHKDILYCDMPNDLIGLNLNNRGLHPRLFILHPFGTKNA